MRALSAADLLVIWENGRSQHPLDRALTVLAAGWPDLSRAELARLSIGERDARLVEMHVALFGAQLAGRAGCPQCAEEIEMTFDANEILRLPPPETHSLTATVDGIALSFRLPMSADVAAALLTGETLAGESAGSAGAAGASRRELLRRCLLCAQRAQDGAPVGVDDLPDSVVDAVGARMAEADPHAEVKFALACPACAHRWTALFDIVSFLWKQIESRAVRLLHEVHTLASAYGWREADILALSSFRRQCYLELAGSAAGSGPIT